MNLKSFQPRVRNVYSICGLPFDAVDIEGAAKIIDESIAAKSDCFISTPNVNFAISAQQNDAFFYSVLNSDISIIDGAPLLGIAKLLKLPFHQRVAGSDLFQFLSNRNCERKIKVFFFGGEKGIAELAHENLNKVSHGMESVGFYDPGFVDVAAMSTENIIHEINACEPDFIVVALGAAKGQKWIMQNKDRLSAPVISHLGAVINFLAGTVKRAPSGWQRLGFEWLWRIVQEPSLWKRYFFDGLSFAKLLLFSVFPLIIYDRWLTKKYNGENLKTVVDDLGDGHFQLSGYFSQQEVAKIYTLMDMCEAVDGSTIVLQMDNIIYIDAAIIAHLMLLQCELDKIGKKLLLNGLSDRSLKIFSYNNVIDRFQINKSAN
jgi:N-acetylglucosaminyldiphosphoundecaprenol N-acetyl-beta-D-mannosaminyltransferase